MARPKHRKGHKEASTRRSAYNRLMRRIETAGQPVEVGKNRFQVLPDAPPENVTVTIDGVSQEAVVGNDGCLTLSDGPTKGTVLQVDYRHIEERVMAQMLDPEHFVITARGTGRSQEVRNFIAQAEAAGRSVLRADVLKQDLREVYGLDPQQDGETVYVSVPKRQLQDVVDTTMRSYSMGCDFGAPGGDKTVFSDFPTIAGRRAGMSASEHLGKQEIGRMLRNYHMEKDATPDPATPRPMDEAEQFPGPGTDPVSLRTPRSGLVLSLPAEERHLDERLRQLAEHPIPEPPPVLMSESTARSMGCVTPDRIVTSIQSIQRGPDVCSICGAIWPCQDHAAHLELGWHRDPETGQPVFDEVSLCKGPDPYGHTTLQFPAPDINTDITNALKNPEPGV